jgi:ABC-2 type transport system ATP-binding protein
MEAATTATPVARRLHDASELSAPARSFVHATGVSKRWRGVDQVVLGGVDLSIAEGEAIHISGRNGVGKTTLLRILAGLITPDAGEVSVAGFHPERDRVAYQQQVGFLPAGDRGLYARLNVRRHLEFWTRVNFTPSAERKPLIEQALERFELSELASRRTDRLSQGQRQRVRLAGLFLQTPRFVMLDEPLNSLDDEASALAVSLFREVTAAGGALIWCAPGDERNQFEFQRAYSLKDGRLELR